MSTTRLTHTIRHSPLRSIGLLLGLGALPLLLACATIMQGSSQEVSIASTPSGAKVFIDGLEHGVTPAAPKLSRKDVHTVRIEMEGYQPWEMKFTRATSGWVWGNIVFGGIPGLAVDAITGGLYKLKPEQVQATLGRTSAQIDHHGDQILVAIVLAPLDKADLLGYLDRE